MSWLLLAILARLFWAATNLVDQYMVRYVQGQSPLVVMMAECLVLSLIIIVLVCFVGFPTAIKPEMTLWLMGGVAVNMAGAVFPYFLALKNDEAHNAVPLMEMAPVFLTFLAWLVFGDILTRTQLWGAALVIAAGFLFAWDFKHGRFRLKTTMLMGVSSIFFAVYQLSMRYAAVNEGVWDVTLVMFFSYFLCGVFMFAVFPRQREALIATVKKTHGKILLAALGEETLCVGATICLVAAFASAPKAGQVAALSATQPIFVLLISTALGFVLPRHCPRLVWDMEMKLKCLLLFVIAGGVMLLKSS